MNWNFPADNAEWRDGRPTQSDGPLVFALLMTSHPQMGVGGRIVGVVDWSYAAETGAPWLPL
jgi:hypothetical protein